MQQNAMEHDQQKRRVYGEDYDKKTAKLTLEEMTRVPVAGFEQVSTMVAHNDLMNQKL